MMDKLSGPLHFQLVPHREPGGTEMAPKDSDPMQPEADCYCHEQIYGYHLKSLHIVEGV